MMQFITNIKNRIRYTRRNKKIKSNIKTSGELECDILHTNSFENFPEDTGYYLSSVYVLFSFNSDDDTLLADMISFCNILNNYKFRFKIYKDDNDIQNLIVEGSLCDYDDIVDIMYNYDNTGEPYDELRSNKFAAKLCEKLTLLPINYFFSIRNNDEVSYKWVDNDDLYNQFSDGNKGYVDFLYHQDKEPFLIEFDEFDIEFISREDDPGLYEKINDLLCYYIAIYSDSDIIDVISQYSDYAIEEYTHNDNKFVIFKFNLSLFNRCIFRNIKDVSFDQLLRLMMYSNEKLHVNYDFIMTDDNDKYYEDIDEIIE